MYEQKSVDELGETAQPLTILAPSWLEPGAVEEIRAINPEARIIDENDVNIHPALLDHVDVAFSATALAPSQLPEAASLKWYQHDSSGVNSLPLEDIEATVTNVHISPDSIAEHTFMLMNAFNRMLPQAIAQQRAGEWDPRPFIGNSYTLRGQTLGILGLGSVGLRIAELGQAYKMNVVGIRRSGSEVPGVTMYTPDQLDKMLGACDHVVNTLPYTAETENIMGRPEFEAMKDTAHYYNLGRGETTNTEELVAAITAGEIQGAGLDVANQEPLPDNHLLLSLRDHPRVLWTPHIAALYPDYKRDATAVFLENFRLFTKGEELVNVIDKERGY